MANKSQTEKNILVMYPEVTVGGGLWVPGVGAIPVDSAGLEKGIQSNPMDVRMASGGAELGTATNPIKNQLKQIRTNLAIHRSAVTAVDKLATPAQLTGADVATGGSLNFNTTYKYNIAANSLFGPTICPTAASQLTANDASATHVVRITTVQTPRAVSYDIFLSTDAAPLWVARITEAQRAAGCTITAVGTVSATTPGANLVDVRVVGTGVASTASPFSVSNAYDTSPGGSAITPISAVGYSVVITQVKLTYTGTLTAVPTFKYVVLGEIQQIPGNYILLASVAPTLVTAVQQPLQANAANNCFGCTNLLVLVDTITELSADIYVDLV
jgi:hypothetical protein